MPEAQGVTMEIFADAERNCVVMRARVGGIEITYDFSKEQALAVGHSLTCCVDDLKGLQNDHTD